MGSVLEVKASNWEKEVLKPVVLTVVDFWHNHCPWCIRLNPMFDDVAEEYKGRVRFAKLNILESPDNQKIAIHYGVMSTPTLLFFCEGRHIGGAVGFMPKENLKRIMDDVIKRHRECIKQSTEIKA